MSSFFLIEQEMKMKTREALREGEKYRLLREARLDHQRWLSRQGCWFLCQLGRLLVALGQQLQRHGQPQIISLNSRTRGGTISGNGEIII